MIAEKESTMNKQEIENQREHIEFLKSEMQAGYADLQTECWSEQRAYIPTCEYTNREGPGTWTDGIDYVVLDDDHVALRRTGDQRDDGDWQISDIDEFVAAVIDDAKDFLERWIADES